MKRSQLRQKGTDMYNKVETNLNFVEREKNVEKFWRENDIFRQHETLLSSLGQVLTHPDICYCMEHLFAVHAEGYITSSLQMIFHVWQLNIICIFHVCQQNFIYILKYVY